MGNKFELTNESKIINGITLYRIKYLKDFYFIKSGDLGGWLEKEENLSQSGDAYVSGNARVSGDAYVSGNARVSGDAYVSGDYNYTKGKFIGGDDSGKITDITDKTGTDYWKNQYVLGDYEITPKEKIVEEKKIVTLELTDDQLEKIKELIK